MAVTINYLFRGRNIHDLSKEEKIELMSILISVLIEKADPRQKSRIHPKKLSEVIEIESGGSIIDSDLMPDDPVLIATLAPLLIKKKDGSNLETDESGRIIRAALNNFPDKTLPDGTSTVLLKSKFINDNFPEILKKDEGLKRAAMYVEFLPELTVQKMISKINTKEYVQATEETNYSDYIVLSIGMLKNVLRKIKNIKLRGKDQIILNKLLNGEIEKDYFELNYEDCMNKIIDCARALKRNLNKQGTEEGFKIDEVCEKIIQARKNCSEVNPDKNDTRRYYTTKVSQYLIGTMDIDKIGSINHILQTVLKRKADSAQTLEEEISLMMASSNTYYTDEMWKRDKELKLGSPKFCERERVLRFGFEDRMLASDSIFTMNLGAMKSFAPNFRDETTLHPLRNRIVDTYRLPWKKTNRRINRTAYIADISGHAFGMVAVLEKYIKENPGPTLEKDVNNLLMALVGTYVKRGFHDLHEVLDVFREPNVVKVFEDCGVKVKLAIPPVVLQKAMNDTLAYSKIVSLKKSMFIEITEKAWIMMSDLAFKKEMQWLKEELENPESIREMLVDPIKRDSINKKKIMLQNVIKRRPDDVLLINELLGIIDRIYFQINFSDVTKKGDLESLEHFIADPRNLKYINTPSMSGITLLSYAAARGFASVVKELIEKGANVRAISDVRKTPFIMAVINGRVDVVTLLGAKASTEEKNIALSFAVEYGKKESVVALLEMGANINYHLTSDGKTPLMSAILKNRVEIFNALLNASPPPNLIEMDRYKLTALHHALDRRQLPMVKAILGAILDLGDLEFILLTAGEDSSKPLAIAKEFEDPELIEVIEDAHKRLEAGKKIIEDKKKMEASKETSPVTFQYGSISGEEGKEGKAIVPPTVPKPPSTTG